MNNENVFDAKNWNRNVNALLDNSPSVWQQFAAVAVATLITMLTLTYAGPIYLLIMVAILTFADFFMSL